MGSENPIIYGVTKHSMIKFHGNFYDWLNVV
jgi:hypothetical protein